MSARPYRVIVGAGYLNLSGVHVFATHLVRGLVERGVDAELLLTEQNTELVGLPPDGMPLPGDIPVRELPCAREAHWNGRWLAMIEYLEQQAPCVYFPNSDYRHSAVSPKLSSRVAIVGVLQADDPVHYDHAQRLGPYWDAIVGVSSRITERVAASAPQLASRLHTIPNAVEAPRQCPARAVDSEAPLRVIYHGVLNTHQKRILDIPEIIERLASRGVAARMTIVGDGPQRQALVERSRGLIERGLIELRGTLPNAEVQALLAEHDVYLLPSAFEGMPHAMLEAMAMGCVPVVSDLASGVPEVVDDGVEGYRVPIGDCDAFAERIERLASDRARLARMSPAAHRRVLGSPYDQRVMVDAYLHVIDRAFETARRGRFRRPHGPVLPPPPTIDGLSIFPVDHAVYVADVEHALAQSPPRRWWWTGWSALWKRASRALQRASS